MATGSAFIRMPWVASVAMINRPATEATIN